MTFWRLGSLAVEHPQGVLLDLLSIVSGELVQVIDEKAAEAAHVRGAIVGRAHRVDDEVDLLQPDRAVEIPQQHDHLDVEIRVGRADRLDTELMVLAVARGLRCLVPEARCRVPDLPRHRRAMFDVGAHDGGRSLGAQGDVSIALVEEVVHLLAYDVGALTHPAEHADLFEHRALQQPVARPLDLCGELADQRLPPRRLGR